MLAQRHAPSVLARVEIDRAQLTPGRPDRWIPLVIAELDVTSVPERSIAWLVAFIGFVEGHDVRHVVRVEIQQSRCRVERSSRPVRAAVKAGDHHRALEAWRIECRAAANLSQLLEHR